MLIDTLFATATLMFTCADVKQVYKLYKVKKVTSLSFTHYKLKIMALVLMIIGYALSKLYLSIVVSIINYILAMTALVLMIKYKEKHTIVKRTKIWAYNGEDENKPKSKSRVQPDPRLTETIAFGERLFPDKKSKKAK